MLMGREAEQRARDALLQSARAERIAALVLRGELIRRASSAKFSTAIAAHADHLEDRSMSPLNVARGATRDHQPTGLR
jgi:hypothetical protein